MTLAISSTVWTASCDDHKFGVTYQATIGIDVSSKNMYLEDKTVRL